MAAITKGHKSLLAMTVQSAVSTCAASSQLVTSGGMRAVGPAARSNGIDRRLGGWGGAAQRVAARRVIADCGDLSCVPKLVNTSWITCRILPDLAQQVAWRNPVLMIQVAERRPPSRSFPT